MKQESPEFAGTSHPGTRVAVLVDGENVSQALAGQIIIKSLGFGQLIIKRVYGNAVILPKWDAAPGFRLMHSGTGKNATDLLLTVEAMALAYGGQADTLVIVSSDRDFTHLAEHLREKGLRVVGMGEAKAPEGFRKSCTQFIVLGPLTMTADDANAPQSGAAAKAADLGPIDTHIHALIRSEGTNGSIPIAHLGARMHALHKFMISTTPQKTWRAYFQARPDLYDCDPIGKEAEVRLRGRSQKP